MQAALYGPFPSRDRDQLRRHARLDGHGRGERRRRVPHRAVQAHGPGYYTYRESLAAERVRARDRDAVRSTRPRRRSWRPRRRCARRSATQQVRPGAQLTDKVTVTGARRARGDGQGRALRAVRDPRRDLVLGHAVLEGHVRRERRRHVHDRAGDDRHASATTPTASRSRRRRRPPRSRASAASTSETSLVDRGAAGRHARSRRRRRARRVDLRPDQRHRPRQLARRRSASSSSGRSPRAPRSSARARRTRTARSYAQGRRHRADASRCG